MKRSLVVYPVIGLLFAAVSARVGYQTGHYDGATEELDRFAQRNEKIAKSAAELTAAANQAAGHVQEIEGMFHAFQTKAETYREETYKKGLLQGMEAERFCEISSRIPTDKTVGAAVEKFLEADARRLGFTPPCRSKDFDQSILDLLAPTSSFSGATP